MPARDITRQGIGLRNVRSRLDMLFGREAALLARQPESGRFEAQITLPLRELRAVTLNGGTDMRSRNR